MKNHIIIMNGPPGSGKDEATNYLVSGYQHCYGYEFKAPLIKIMEAFYGNDYCAYGYSLLTQRDKLEPREELDGLSIRETLIQISEDVIKPWYGNDFIGKCVGRQVRKRLLDGIKNRILSTIIFSDGGFPEEIEGLYHQVKDLHTKITLIRLYSENCTYSGDSRGYLEESKYIDDIYDVVNYKNDKYYEDLHNIYKEITGV